MVLNRLGGEIDITQLNVEVPQPETTPRIDIEDIIDERVWEHLNHMLQSFEVLIKAGIDNATFEMAATMRLLFPQRKISLDTMEITDDAWDRINSYSLAVLKPETRYAAPSRLSAVYELLEDETFELMDNKKLPIEFLIAIYHMKLIFPERNARWSLTDEQWMAAKEMIENPDAFFAMAIVKMIYPERFKDLDIKPEYWREWLEALKFPNSLNHLSVSNINDLLKLALSLKVLSAKEAKITLDGLAVVNEDPKPVKNDLTPVPEGRNF
jgi:hypothetical protein